MLTYTSEHSTHLSSTDLYITFWELLGACFVFVERHSVLTYIQCKHLASGWSLSFCGLQRRLSHPGELFAKYHVIKHWTWRLIKSQTKMWCFVLWNDNTPILLLVLDHAWVGLCFSCYYRNKNRLKKKKKRAQWFRWNCYLSCAVV